MKEQFKTWWNSLSEREQQLSLVSAAFLLLAVVYWGGWLPLANRLQESEKQRHDAQQTLAWVEHKAAVLVQAGVNKQRVDTHSLTLIQSVNRSAKQYGIHFSRIVNKREQIEVWISDVEFDLFVRWLNTLNNQYGVSVSNTDFSKIEPQGHIKINRLLLEQ